MKKICSILALGIIMSLSSFAQSNMKPFKVDLSLGYALVGGSGTKGGILFALEPKYAVLNSLSVGVRMEGAVIARFSGYDDEGNANATVKAAGSYLATGDYYLGSNYSLRPFVGAGMGLFTIAGAHSNTSGTEGVTGGAKFGGMLRGGVELAHLRLGLEYNIVPSTKFEGFDVNGELADLKSKNSYVGIKLGVCIGGGPRK